MNETDFQALFTSWNTSPEDSPERKKACDRLHAIIYYFPQKLFRISADISSEFYLYCYERVESYFLGYQSELGLSFLSWLAICLKRDFLNFYRRRKRPADRELLHESVEWETEVVLTHHTESGKEPWADFVRDALAGLKEKDRIHLKLHFGFELNYADLRFMCQKLGIASAFRNYRRFLFYLQDVRKDFRMARKEILEHLSDVEQSIFRHGLTQELLARRNRLQEKYFAQAAVIPLRIVAETTGDPLANVHRKVQSARKKIEKALLKKTASD